MEDSTPNSPPPPPAPMRPGTLAALAMALGLLLFLTAGATTQLLNPAFGIWFTEVFIFFGVGWVLLRYSGRDPLRYTGLSQGAPLPSLFGFALSVANFFALVVPIQYTVQALTPDWLQKMFDSSALFEGQTPLELALIIGGVSIAAPVCEEFFFRGLLQNSLMSPRLTRTAAIVVTSVIFSAFHLDPVGFLARVELGVLFGVLLVRTGSLWPSILAHSANNLVSTLIFLASRQAGVAQAEAETDPWAVLLLAAMGGAAMWGLLAATRAFPALWGPGEFPEPDFHASAQPRPSLFRLLVPWVLGGTIAVTGLALVDARGIRLSTFDARYPLPPIAEQAPAGLHAERNALKELRAQARRGEIPVERYEEERVRQVERHRLDDAKPTPATVSPLPREGEGPDAGTTGSGSGTR